MGAADADHARGVRPQRPGQPVAPAGERFAAQALTGPPLRSAAAVAERLLAIQAQDPRGFRLAVRARTTGVRNSDVERALAGRALVVSWLNRGTLHLVRAEDYWWLHALTTPSLSTGNARRLAQEGVSPAQAERGVRIVAGALADGPLTRRQLAETLAAQRIPTAGQALVHLLFRASLQGLVVRGPVAGSEQAYVLARDWVGPPPGLDRGAALAMLARRYLAGHGPASDRDLARWAGVPLRDARAGLSAIAPSLADRPDGLAALKDAARPAGVPSPRLLGSYEPVLMGWTSRSWVLGAHEPNVVSGGLFRPFALVDGRAAATWRLANGGVAVEPFGTVPALDDDARDVADFLAR